MLYRIMVMVGMAAMAGATTFGHYIDINNIRADTALKTTTYGVWPCAGGQ